MASGHDGCVAVTDCRVRDYSRDRRRVPEDPLCKFFDSVVVEAAGVKVFLYFHYRGYQISAREVYGSCSQLQIWRAWLLRVWLLRAIIGQGWVVCVFFLDGT